MPEMKVVFFDVGGVLLSNGWDRRSRRDACQHFDLDWQDFQDRHDSVFTDFETGELTLDGYLQRTVFYRDQPFTGDEFYSFMKSQSEALPESMALLRELSESGTYLLATLNNESRELNDYRIENFGLRDHFSLFLSSCYLGVRKPEPEIYQIALDITQQVPEQCVFIDDRELNLECAELAGMRAIHFRDAAQLRGSFAELGVGV